MVEKEDRVKESLHGLIRLFESGQAPAAMAVGVLPPPNIPAAQWSLGNNLLLWIAGTGDARGFRQWEKAGRRVQKGTKAIYILAPAFKVIVVDAPEGKKEKKQVLSGFRGLPVFRFEDTEGDPLQYHLDPPEPPPLMDVAQAWGLTVRYAGATGPYMGYYRHNKDRAPEITLATHDEQVFFHELSHAAQYRVWPDIKPDQKLRKEVAAELASCVLARIYGRKAANEGFTFQYIQHYCEQYQRPLGKTLWALVADTDKIILAIMEAHLTAAVTTGSEVEKL
jgi:hypothetical protein